VFQRDKAEAFSLGERRQRRLGEDDAKTSTKKLISIVVINAHTDVGL